MKKASGGLVLNPVLTLAIIYFLANLYSFILLISGGEIFVDALVRTFEESVVYVTGAALIASFLFLLLLYRLGCKFFYQKEELSFSCNWGWFLVIIQCAYLVNNIYYNVNLAGVEDVGAGSPFKLFFSMFQPDLIYLVLAVGIVSNRLFWLNLVIFSFSMVLRGWMGGFLVVFIIYLCRSYPVKIGLKPFLWLSTFLFVCILLFPFFIELKWVLRSGGYWGGVWNNVVDQGYLSSLGNSLAYLLSRFQMFGHIALITENSNEIANSYENNEFIPYWADGLIQWFILKINDIEVFQLNRYMVNVFFDSDNMAYSTNPGIAGWILFLQFGAIAFIAYICMIVLLPAFYMFRYAGQKYFLLLFSFVFIYLFHGWIGAYFNLVIYLVFFLYIKRKFFKKIP